MTAHSVTVELPEVLFRRIERAARGLNQPMPQALLKIVESGLPSLDKVPARHRSELEAMETWSDQQLWRVAREALPADQQQELSDLLDKNQQGELSAIEEARLDALHAQANRLLLRKSYALALLKWRGNKVPAFGPAAAIN
jgi:hypothetical protein